MLQIEYTRRIPKEGIPVRVATNCSGNYLALAQEAKRSGVPILTLLKLPSFEEFVHVEYSVTQGAKVFDVIFIDNDVLLYLIRNEGLSVLYKVFSIKDGSTKTVYSSSVMSGSLRIINSNKLFLFSDEVFRLFEFNNIEFLFLKDLNINCDASISDSPSIAIVDDAYLVSGEVVGEISQYRIENSTLVQKFYGDFSFLSELVVSEKYLIGINEFGAGLFVWKLIDGLLLEGRYFNNESFRVSSVAISKDDELIAIANHIGYITLCGTLSGELLGMERIHNGCINSLVFLGEKGRMASVGNDGELKLIKITF